MQESPPGKLEGFLEKHESGGLDERGFAYAELVPEFGLAGGFGAGFFAVGLETPILIST